MANDSEANMWGIHAGSTADGDSYFRQKNCIALGWPKVGNLSALAPNMETFKSHVASAYPEKKPGAIPTFAGQLLRFAYEMTPGDLVVYPSRPERQIYLGRITGEYKFDPKASPSYPNVRSVKWLKPLPRTHFSQGALYEIGAAMALFKVKNYAEEFRAAADGKPLPLLPVEQDESVGTVAVDIEDTTRDFIVKRLAQQLKGHPFADFVGHLLNTMGYRTRVSPPGIDGGIDIVAHKDELGFEPPIIKIQVKSTEGTVGEPAVAALYGKVGPSEYGLFVNLGTFTAQAKAFGKSKSNLRLIDGDELVELIFQHYDQFDSRYKGLLPLRRVYVPEVIESEEE